MVDTKSFAAVKKIDQERLNREEVFQLEGQGEDYLWILTSASLYLYELKTDFLHQFTSSHGLDRSEIISLKMVVTDDFIYLASPRSIKKLPLYGWVKNTHQPKSIITGFQINGAEYLPFIEKDKLSVRLNHDQHSFNISFTNNNYLSPTQNVFKYKMEGLDADWIKTDTRNTIQYLQVNPGTYQFKVKAPNNEH